MGTETLLFSTKKHRTARTETSSKVLLTQMGYGKKDNQAVERIVLDYFNSIFQSNGPTDTATIIVAIRPVVTNPMNEYLCQTLHKALKQMHPKKSPSPNGMPPLFYQHSWSLSGECVTKVVLDFLKFGSHTP